MNSSTELQLILFYMKAASTVDKFFNFRREGSQFFNFLKLMYSFVTKIYPSIPKG